ncbi:MAG TPA: hypothetical protein VKZ60_02800 [Chloroflexota bacterium]|nr:hypothetical protein [Chloroflexota bacterium]
MAARRGAHGWRVGLLCVLLAAPAAGVPAPAMAQDWQTRATRYFTIYYTAEDASTAEQYAAFVDDLYTAVAMLFDHGPSTPVPLRLYATVDAYGAANPIARFVGGVVAHADPRRGEIGVATPRLAHSTPEQVRDTLRHELMHLVATELSGDRLPIGFQEGLAQYTERESSERRELAQTLAVARAQGRLLSWDELNEPRRFLGRLTVAYPQALSVVAFLFDRYGPGPFKRFLVALHGHSEPWQAVLAAVYGRPVPELEAEWRDYLPAYLARGWERNLLDALDLTAAQARLAAGDYAAAQASYAEAQRLHTELDQPRLAAEAARGRERAEHLLAATDLAHRGRALLAERRYPDAAALLEQAAARYTAAGLPAAVPTELAELLQIARRGAEADALLQTAQHLAASWRYPEARARALEAATRYRELNDLAGAQRASGVQEAAEAGQRQLALLLLATGTMILTGSLALWGAQRRRIAHARAAAGARREEGMAL